MFENTSIGPSSIWTGQTPLSEYWTPPECLQVSVHAYEWELNSPWTPIECAWLPLGECEHPTSEHDCHYVIIECESPWCDHEKNLMCVKTEHALNACECAWMPVSDYWTPPERLWVRLNANEWVLNTPWTPIECAWTSMSEWEQLLNTHWVRMNAFE